MAEPPTRPPITRKASRIHDAIADIVAQFDPLKKAQGPSALALEGATNGIDGSEGTTALGTFEPSAHFKADTEGFDYSQFLQQLRQPGAKAIARNIRNFLNEFHRRPLTLKEQIRVVHDYIDFITAKMGECDIWKGQSEQDFENTREAVEKLLMNRLHAQTFCPATTDDDEKDKILDQKINLFRWVTENHLDIKTNTQNDSFLAYAVAELLKMNTFKAPRDKMICILNCCTVIFGLLKHSEGIVGADIFLPVLIYVVIKANPPQLISNVQYISRFRSPDKLQAESGYYLTNLMGAISFLETMDASCLSITQEEFDKNIELTILEMNSEQAKASTSASSPTATTSAGASAAAGTSHQRLARCASEPSAASPAEKAAVFLERFAQRTIEKPLNFVGKLLSDLTTPDTSDEDEPTHAMAPTVSSPPAHHATRSDGGAVAAGSGHPAPPSLLRDLRGEMFPGEHSSRHQQSPESNQEFASNLHLLREMFPNVEPDVCQMVLQANHGYVPATIESLLDIAKTTPVDSSVDTPSFGLDDSVDGIIGSPMLHTATPLPQTSASVSPTLSAGIGNSPRPLLPPASPAPSALPLPPSNLSPPQPSCPSSLSSATMAITEKPVLEDDAKRHDTDGTDSVLVTLASEPTIPGASVDASHPISDDPLPGRLGSLQLSVDASPDSSPTDSKATS
ncbi:hypothetical protein H4R34_001447 [Dimargaris verticillata]|uniref:VPS9 domain-containing protein n=1 Tax=Dimargaris verticillata TaxID=2761393 RepID=A0A9W8B9Z5_9FUNG|nr:hypothetical protein H4R34_001447 [Dimargaris verticillata]